MTLIELLVVGLVVALSVLSGKYLYPHIGWWCLVPAPILGVGAVLGLFKVLDVLFRRRPSSSESK